MFTRLAQSWELTKQSWSVLRADKHLIVFPILSGAAIIVAIALVLLPAGFIAAAAGVFEALSNSSGKSGPSIEPLWQVGGLVVLFLLYFVSYTVATFFNVALMACAMARFNGEDSSARAGLALAWKRLPQILMWSAVNATVGVILEMLKERAGWLGRWIISLVGVAWNIATFFVVPVLVVEGVGPIDAIKRSAMVLKKTWGQSLVAQVGVSLVLGLISVGVLIAFVGGGVALGIVTSNFWVAGVLIGIGVLLAIVIGLISTTLKQILVAACYRFATTEMVPSQFDGQTLRGMFSPKK